VIYLAWCDADLADLEEQEGPWVAMRPLHRGLAVIESDETRSRVYHALKWSVPPGTPLLVSALHEVPKAKGLRPGWSAWLRSRLPRG
jgi:hypothetical protein